MYLCWPMRPCRWCKNEHCALAYDEQYRCTRCGRAPDPAKLSKTLTVPHIHRGHPPVTVVGETVVRKK